jgi:hypothetical protein
MNANPSVDLVIERLGLWRNDAVATLELLNGYRQQVEQHRAQLENPQAVSEYLAFFVDMAGSAVAACERIAGELSGGIERRHIDSLREVASRGAAEQRRCLQFRDKCINKPLPHESMRPLLNDLSIATRDQLTALGDLGATADRLETLITKAPEATDSARSFDRRALFTRLFKS